MVVDVAICCCLLVVIRYTDNEIVHNSPTTQTIRFRLQRGLGDSDQRVRANQCHSPKAASLFIDGLIYRGASFLFSNNDMTRFCPGLIKKRTPQMSVTAYGMLLHGYRWKLHYRVATFMSNQEGLSDTTLARHWLQVRRTSCTMNVDGR